ncbi:hypothetical protein TNIN_249961 [Trichonephila inaurata madagascariensis]|uniref:Uncharacterized protein n=1 Tax=Trichonephila inaurata madagascariensis TaxID=2747483 RepID=A0A8X6MJ41_9ARAC|nr:hypothetical protein TNIN_249961 [Trichonephila inaurata madagascariensis]
MSALMSIKGHSDSLDRSLHSVPRWNYFSDGSAAGVACSGFAACCWREALHTLPTSMPGRGCKQRRISWLSNLPLNGSSDVTNS